VCRGISANGAKPFKACFTGINGDGEPLFGLGTLSTKMEEVKDVLLKWKAVIERTGGTVRPAPAASSFLSTAPNANHSQHSSIQSHILSAATQDILCGLGRHGSHLQRDLA
jgi:hypothetical protein